MKTIIFHNILWSHYKGKVFSELYSLSTELTEFEIKFSHIAETEQGRRAYGDPDMSIHRYPYEVLFEGNFHDTSFFDRFMAMRRAVIRFRPQVVVLYGYYDPAVWLLTFYLKFKGIKIIQSSDSVYAGSKRVYYKELWKSFLLQRADLVFCYGTMQKEYLQRLGVEDQKIHIRVQATDNDAYLRLEEEKSGDENERPLILYVGRLAEEKNLESLILTFKCISSNWKLLLIGSGPKRSELLALIGEDQDDRIQIADGMAWHEVVNFYYAASLFVLPSRSEPWGLVVNEAMLCGLPVLVSSNVGCSKDLVKEGINGYIFEIDNPVDFQEKMTHLMNMDQEDLDRMGQMSKSIISAYTPKRAALQMLMGIQSLGDYD